MFEHENAPVCIRSNEVPMSSLAGMQIDGRQPTERQQCFERKIPTKWRPRSQVGITNRWRLESPRCDMLGQSQAIRSFIIPFNRHMVQLLTAENAKSSVNVDMERPYAARVNADLAPTPAARLTSDLSTPTATSLLARLNTSFRSSRSSQSNYATSRSNTNSCSMPPIQPIKSFVPSSARYAKPYDIFMYHLKRKRTWGTADGLPSPKSGHVTLRCLDIDWELHQPFVAKSQLLAGLLDGATVTSPRRSFRSEATETLDTFISRTPAYSRDYRERSSRLSMQLDEEPPPTTTDSEQAPPGGQKIQLAISDPMISQSALAVALGNLYHDDVEVDVRDVAGVSAASHVLRFPQLQQACNDIMLKTIKSSSVCAYHKVAAKYHCDAVSEACERWLELNLVTKLGMQIHLRDLSMAALHKVLRSPRLFTFSEFTLFRVVAYWLFMQLNPSMQLVPSYNTVVAFFNSLPKTLCLIEREEGCHFAEILSELRLHGIMETWQLQHIQSMNIIPQTAVVDIFSQHYHALQNGGDMSLLLKLEDGAIRHGFIIDEEPYYHSQLVSLFGFHFELKAIGDQKSDSYSFFMQRLKPNDPTLSFRQCERQTFSMRPDRDVLYSVRVQYVDADGVTQNVYSGALSRRFGQAEKTSLSDVLTFDGLVPPLYVTFCLLFPPS